MYVGGCEMHRGSVAGEGGETGAMLEVCWGRGSTCSFKRPQQLWLGVRNTSMNLCRCCAACSVFIFILYYLGWIKSSQGWKNGIMTEFLWEHGNYSFWEPAFPPADPDSCLPQFKTNLNTHGCKHLICLCTSLLAGNFSGNWLYIHRLQGKWSCYQACQSSRSCLDVAVMFSFSCPVTSTELDLMILRSDFHLER